jgi:dihydroflavonol-4-reductase
MKDQHDMDEARTVAVTGGTGFLGSNLTRRLIATGRSVTVLVRDAAKLGSLGLEPTRVVVGDIRDPAAVAQVVEGADAVIHTVSNFRTASQTRAEAQAVNAGGTRLVVEAAERAGVKRLLHCSTIGVHGHVADTPATEEAPFAPGDDYQETKLEAEQVVRARISATPMAIVILRPSSMYGPGDMRMLKMFRMLASRRFMMLGACEENFHAVYIDDVVDGFLLALTHPAAVGQTFFVGGPAYLPLRDYIAAAARAVAAPMPWLRLPYAPMHAAAVVCEALCAPLRIEPPLHVRRVRFFKNNRAFDIAKARRLLGYAPKVGLDEGLARTVAWYRSQGLLPPARG